MRYRFANCVLCLDRRELTRDSKLIALAPQVFDLLAYLIRNRERMVSKDELTRAIWKGRAVSDAALTTRIYVARTAIGDNGRDQQHIRTLARRGIRFVGHVEEISASANDRSPIKLLVSHASKLLVSHASLLAARREPSICVHAFQHAHPDRTSWTLGTILTEQLRIELTKRRWLSVLAAGDEKSLAANAAEEPRASECCYLLRGSINHIAGRCRVSVEVVDTVSGVNIWAARYDTRDTDKLKTQRSI